MNRHLLYLEREKLLNESQHSKPRVDLITEIKSSQDVSNMRKSNVSRSNLANSTKVGKHSTARENYDLETTVGRVDDKDRAVSHDDERSVDYLKQQDDRQS